jgi:hypothetical protein
MSMNGTKAAQYMREWMNLTAVSSFMNTGSALLGTAINREGIRKEYMVSLEIDSEGQYNVYDRTLNGEDEWEWVDAISEKE